MENLLNAKERRVLESLFKLGKSSVNEISKDTLVNRTALYHPLDSLSRKGLVTCVEKNKVSFYEAIPIDQYEVWANKKLASFTDSIATDIKTFSSIKKDRSDSLYADVKYFEGFEAVKNLYADTIYNNKENQLYSITDYEKGYATLGPWVRDEYLPERVKRGVRVKNLVPDSAFGRKYIATANELLRDICFVDLFKDLGIEVNLYDEKIAIVSFDEHHPVGIIIQNKIITKAFREIFNYIWKTGNVVTDGNPKNQSRRDRTA